MRIHLRNFDRQEQESKWSWLLYKYLKTKKSGFFGSRIKWNFTKFLIGRDGEVVKRYAPTVTPE